MKDKLGTPEEYKSKLNEVSIEDLADIRDVEIDPSLPVEEKMRSSLFPL